MNELATLLDELVADAPVEKASWTEVVVRSRRIGSPRRARKRLVIALAVVLLLSLGGTAVGVGFDLLRQQEGFHASVSDDPTRLGPLVEVASGDGWALIAWRSEAGLCLDFAIPRNSPFACGFPVPGAKRGSGTSGSGTHAIAGFFSGGNLVGGDGKATIFGAAAPDVAAVKVELGDGRIIEAPLQEAPPELRTDVRFFLLRLTLAQLERGRESPVRAYSAYDRGGGLIERVPD